jgi:uncharacterized protein
MKRRFLFVTLFPMLLLVAVAQDSTPSAADAAPAAKEDIQKLFEVMQIHQQMRLVMDSVMKQQSVMMHDTLKKRYPQVSAEKIARADRMMQETMKDMPMDAMLDDMIPIYQRHFSKGDIDAMTTFYASPTGQKVMREMPVLTTESMQASYARMQKQMDAIMRRTEQMIKEDKADQENKGSTPTTPSAQQKN